MKKVSHQHLSGALASILVVIALLVGAFASHNLHLSGAASRTLSDINGTKQAKAHANARITVSFLGPFSAHKHPHSTQCGPAVRLMEGALRRKHFRTAPARYCMGIATEKQLKKFQRSIHYKPTGIYNLATHRALVARGGYNLTARIAMVYIAHLQFVARVQRNILIITTHAILVGGNTLPYTQSASTRAYFPPWPRLPPATDCSGFVTWILYQAGVGAGVGYYGPGSSVGWTGSMLHQGTLVPGNGPLRIGDMVIYYGHVEIYIGHGKVEGHGSTGVHIHSYNYRAIDQVRRVF